MSPHIRYLCLRSVHLRGDDKGESGDDKGESGDDKGESGDDKRGKFVR
jgi:hypothetical protein